VPVRACSRSALARVRQRGVSYSTFSPISALEPASRQEFLDSVAHIAEVDFGGRVEIPLVTSLYVARRPV